MRRRFIGAIVALGLFGCGGGGGNSSLPASPNRASGPQNTAVTVRLVVPGASSTNATVRRKQSVSQNTMGIQVVAYATGDRTTPLGTTSADISASSTSCAATGNDGRTCTFPLQAPVGDDDFVATTYDALPGNFNSANELGYGVATQTISIGDDDQIALTLNPVLTKIRLGLSPASLHTLIPGTATLSVYALDADNDTIVSNAFMDIQGNSVTASFAFSDDDNGSLSVTPTSISAPAPGGVLINYNGQAAYGTSTTLNETADDDNVTDSNVSFNLVYPSFSQINDPHLNVNNPYHGGIVFDGVGGAYYTTPSNFGGISYYAGPTGSNITDAFSTIASQPIRGGIASSGSGVLYAVAGTQPSTFSAPPSTTFQPASYGSPAPAPIPNGSAMAYDGNHQGLWYTSGSALAFYPLEGGSPQTISLGINVAAGLAVDSSSNVWVVDTVNDALVEYPGTSNALQPGGQPFDVLVNSNGIWVTDHGSNPAILQLNASGVYQSAIALPDGAIPWYEMPDNAQSGIIWFDYLLNGQIGIGRMDTNVQPATFSMATDVNGPTGTQAGAIGAASNGLVYMVFDGTSTLVQVQR